jgi:hypothetical protein
VPPSNDPDDGDADATEAVTVMVDTPAPLAARPFAPAAPQCQYTRTHTVIMQGADRHDMPHHAASSHSPKMTRSVYTPEGPSARPHWMLVALHDTVQQSISTAALTVDRSLTNGAWTKFVPVITSSEPVCAVVGVTDVTDDTSALSYT